MPDSVTPPDIKQVARECNEIALANGFDAPSWDNFIIKIALAAGELDEARDGALGLGKDPIEEELSDVAIRVICVLDAVWEGDWSDRVTGRTPKHICLYSPIETLLWAPLGYLFKSMEARRHDNRAEAKTCLELAILEVWRLADAMRVDLFVEIAAKCEKNRSRPRLHGKSYAAG